MAIQITRIEDYVVQKRVEATAVLQGDVHQGDRGGGVGGWRESEICMESGEIFVAFSHFYTR